MWHVTQSSPGAGASCSIFGAFFAAEEFSASHKLPDTAIAAATDRVTINILEHVKFIVCLKVTYLHLVY
jgi:hypothetical protein